jgi:hypothetical protein
MGRVPTIVHQIYGEAHCQYPGHEGFNKDRCLLIDRETVDADV